MSDSDDLDELRERLRATREAAERIAGRVPPQGWAAVSEEARSETAAELQALVAVLHALRDVVPDELWDHVRELARQLLVFLRALLDLVVERLSADRAGKRPRAAGPDLQDIPIT
jgi:hypothetical protein